MDSSPLQSQAQSQSQTTTKKIKKNTSQQQQQQQEQQLQTEENDNNNNNNKNDNAKYWSNECDIRFLPYGCMILFSHVLSDCVGIVSGFLFYYCLNRGSSFNSCNNSYNNNNNNSNELIDESPKGIQYRFGLWCILLIAFSLANIYIFLHLLIFILKHNRQLSDDHLGCTNTHFRVFFAIGLLSLMGWVIVSSLMIDILLKVFFHQSEIHCSDVFFNDDFISSNYFHATTFAFAFLAVMILLRYFFWILWCCRACFWDCNCTECAYHYCCCFVRLCEPKDNH